MAGCSRKQCILPSFSSKQTAIYVAVLLDSPKVALYFTKPAAIYTGAYFLMPSRQPGCTVASVSRAGSNLCRRKSRSRGRRPSLVRRRTASGMAAAWLAAAETIYSAYGSSKYFSGAGSKPCSSSPLFPEGRLIFSVVGSSLYRRNNCFFRAGRADAQ